MVQILGGFFLRIHGMWNGDNTRQEEKHKKLQSNIVLLHPDKDQKLNIMEEVVHFQV